MINLIYVGSYGGLCSPWLNNRKSLDFVLSCDPFESGCKRVKKGKHFKKALFSENGNRDFYVLKKKECSSLYFPNYDFIEGFSGKVPSKYKLIEIQTIECARLDGILCSMDVEMDFISSDTQGSDFDVINGMGTYINDLVGLHVELYLQPFYKGAVLFEEADKFFKNNGFYLAKRLRKNPVMFDNFVYLRKDTDKKEKLKFVKKIFEVE